MTAQPKAEAERPEGEVLIQFDAVQKRLGGQHVLKGVNLSIYRGETMVIIGRSGGGKSVLIKHVVGLIMPDAGAVYFDGENVSLRSERQLGPLRSRVGILFQGGALFDSLNVEENVAFPLVEAGEKDRSVLRKRVGEALEVVGLLGQEKKMPVNLSGGMRKRVGLARAVVARPSCILYDEPTSGLDPVATDSIDHLIRHLKDCYSVTSLVITHDMKSAWHIADRITYLHEGRIHYTGTPEDVAANPDPLIRNFVEGRSEGSVECQ